MPSLPYSVSMVVRDCPPVRTSDSWKRILPGTSMSKRWTFRWTARRVPWGENVRDVLYRFLSFFSGIEPPIR